MGRACSTNGENRNAYRILVGKPEGMRPLEKQARRNETTGKTSQKERDHWEDQDVGGGQY
jgi:hypothetical protein